MPQISAYNKSPTYKPSSCELSKTQTCVHVFRPVRVMCLAYIVTRMHRLQTAVLLRAWQYHVGSSSIGSSFQDQDIIYDERGKLLPRHRWIIFSKGVDIVESSKEPEAALSVSGVGETASPLHLLLLAILLLHHLPPPPSPVSSFSCLFTQGQPLCVSCTAPFKVLYC